jgi:hypothetical protein
MSLRSIVESSAVGSVRQARAANAEKPTGYRERLPSRPKIIMRSRIQDHHGVGWPESLLIAQRISTGPGGDCEARFFPDDSDVSATDFFRALSEVDPAEVSILCLSGRRIDHERAN